MANNNPLYETASMAFERRLSKRMLAELKEWQERNLKQKNEQDDLSWLKEIIEDEAEGGGGI
jgi:hypothetical protein